MLICILHNKTFLQYNRNIHRKKKEIKKLKNHVPILVLIDFCTSLGRAKRPKWDVQNVLIQCVDRVERSKTQRTICFVQKLYTPINKENFS